MTAQPSQQAYVQHPSKSLEELIEEAIEELLNWKYSEVGTARAINTKFIISKTQQAFLLLQIATGGSGEAEVNINVGSSIPARFRRAIVGANDRDTIMVPVPPNESWEAQVSTSGTAKVTLASTYVLIGE